MFASFRKPGGRFMGGAAFGALAIVTLLAADGGQAQDKKAAPARWAVLKAEFKVAERIADPIAPPGGKKPAQPAPRFEFGPEGGKLVKPGMEKETPYVTISRASDVRIADDTFKLVDGLGQEHATPSQIFNGRGSDTLVFRRDNWKQWGELYLAGPGNQKVALAKFLPLEQQAAWKFTTAKILSESDADKARSLCTQILKDYSRTKAAKDAKLLLDSLKK